MSGKTTSDNKVTKTRLLATQLFSSIQLLLKFVLLTTTSGKSIDLAPASLLVFFLQYTAPVVDDAGI